ncbi:SDR family oxidoreductase [Maribacter sp. 2307UL18-2]|uniref:SDR family oxidoreductase n=1 Tax=Maribacter sp. 2307UL18-2 TaxID=3386274 RepID=UPI0039BD51A2
MKRNGLNPEYRILVTGGAGFIGSNICEELLKNGNYVRCLDNLSTGNPINISDFAKNPKFEFIEGDIRNINVCQKSCQNIDYVLHQAALGSVPRSIDDPIRSNEVNVTGFLNMLIAARDNNTKRFVYAASSSTYGDSKDLPKREEKIGKPLSPYAVTKLVNELYADIFAETFGMEVIGLRYFNVFGKNQDPDSVYAAVIPKFIDLLLRHKSPKINGDGTFSRDFTHVSNVVQANINSLLVKNVKALNTVYNVACGKRTTLNDLTHWIKHFLSNYDPSIRNIPIVHGTIRRGDIPHSLASIEKAKRLLEYNPTTNLEEGLRTTVSWYWNNLPQTVI